MHVTHVEREFRKSRHADIVFARVHTQDKKNVRSGGWMFVAIPLEDFNDFVDKLGNVIDDSKGHEELKRVGFLAPIAHCLGVPEIILTTKTCVTSALLNWRVKKLVSNF